MKYGNSNSLHGHYQDADMRIHNIIIINTIDVLCVLKSKRKEWKSGGGRRRI